MELSSGDEFSELGAGADFRKLLPRCIFFTHQTMEVWVSSEDVRTPHETWRTCQACTQDWGPRGAPGIGLWRVSMGLINGLAVGDVLMVSG